MTALAIIAIVSMTLELGDGEAECVLRKAVV